MFNMRNPLSAFSSREPNAASYMIAQQQQNIDNAIAYLVDLWFDDVDIREEEIFYSVLKKYKLTNISSADFDHIVQQVNMKIARTSSL